MTTQHTPGLLERGPLFMHEYRNDGMQVMYSIGAENYRAADGTHIALAVGITDRKVANLFAAAPELLACLIACSKQLEAETLGGSALDRARALISKIKGTK